MSWRSAWRILWYGRDIVKVEDFITDKSMVPVLDGDGILRVPGEPLVACKCGEENWQVSLELMIRWPDGPWAPILCLVAIVDEHNVYDWLTMNATYRRQRLREKA